MKKIKAAKDIKGRIKQINHVLRYWKKIFREVPDFSLARKRRMFIKEPLLAERNKLVSLIRASKKQVSYSTL